MARVAQQLAARPTTLRHTGGVTIEHYYIRLDAFSPVFDSSVLTDRSGRDGLACMPTTVWPSTAASQQGTLRRLLS